MRKMASNDDRLAKAIAKEIREARSSGGGSGGYDPLEEREVGSVQ